jgi:endogenous inhibitor of DNA gyrase (YacG/DUF329 family)
MPKYIPTEDELLVDIPCYHCGRMFTPLSIDDEFCSERCMIDQEMYNDMMYSWYEEESMEEDYYE